MLTNFFKNISMLSHIFNEIEIKFENSNRIYKYYYINS